MVESSDQLAGSRGVLPDASVISSSEACMKPSLSRKSRCRSAPISIAMRAVPTLEDLTITLVTLSSGP